MRNQGRFYSCKTVMGNLLSLDSRLRASDEVIHGLPGFYKLFNDLLMGARNYTELAERMMGLLKRSREAGMALGRNKIQVGKKVGFGGYIIDDTIVDADPKKAETTPSSCDQRT